MTTTEVISHVVAAIAGAIGGSLLTLRITRRAHVTGSGRVVDQSGSRVKGDQIGGNKTHR
jgi:hypothetical protein